MKNYDISGIDVTGKQRLPSNMERAGFYWPSKDQDQSLLLLTKMVPPQNPKNEHLDFSECGRLTYEDINPSK